VIQTPFEGVVSHTLLLVRISNAKWVVLGQLVQGLMGNIAVLAKRKVYVWLSLNLAMRKVQTGLKHLLQLYWVSQWPWQVLV
jgi:hypothetical protein